MNVTPNPRFPEPQGTSEADMVKAAQQDPAKFAALYNRYYEPVFRFAYQRLDDKDTAFDITSQVFLKAMISLSKYEERGLPFGSWLFRIARNELNMLFRANKNSRTLNVETDGLARIAEDMEDDALAEYHEDMITAIADLSEDELSLVEMRYFEKRSFREIGEILEITENYAKVKMYRVLDKLKKQIISKSR